MSKIAFLFPGQGAQYVGMGKDLYENNEIAKKQFDEVFSNIDIDLKEVMFNGPDEKLKETSYTQPGIVLLSLVLANILKEKGIEPDYVAGHSLGEYSALGAANILDTLSTVKLAALRGSIMNSVTDKIDGTMAAIIGLDSNIIEQICSEIDGTVEAVNYNEPKQTVIAGEKIAVEKACEKLKEAGARRALILQVSGPFHSSLMRPAGEELKTKLDEFNFVESKIKFIANTDANIKEEISEIKEELYKQTFGPVKWVDTIIKLRDSGVTKFYEIGPGNVLKGLAKKIDKTIDVISIGTLEELANL